MKISITYCVAWNYLPQATRMAARISEAFGLEPELIKGRNGVFDVVADDKLVFSKHQVGRFPDDEEVIKLLLK